MTIPSYQELMLPILRLAQEGEVALTDAVKRLVSEFRLTPEEEISKLPSGQAVIHNRTGWAKTELVKAGLIEQPARGKFRITERGRELLQRSPASISRAFLVENYPEFRAYIEASQERAASASQKAAELAIGNPAAVTPDEQLDNAYKTLTAALEADVLAKVRSVDPSRFEQLVVDLLLAMNFGGGDREMGKRLGRSGDGGIDGVIQEDALGLDAVYVQAKRYRDGSNIGAATIREFIGSLVGHRASKGVFVTSSKFTPDAREFAKNVQQRVVLIDGEELSRLLVRHGVAVREDRRIIIKKLDDDYFEE